MDVTCPGCNTKYKNIDDKMEGRSATCKKCGAEFTLKPMDEEAPVSGKTTKFNYVEQIKEETPPMETVVDGAPMETVVEGGPMETVVEHAPMETVVEGGPMETVVEGGPMETVVEHAPIETVVEGGPMETVVEGGPIETVVEGGPSETVIEGGPAATMAEKAEEDYSEADVAEASDAEAAVPADWNIGDTILDLYEVNSLLGEGGMGKVFKVFHRTWQIELAVKSPKPEELKRVGGAANFEKEAETWVNLGLHPNTVSCYYVRRLGGVPRLFAELVEGGSLQDWIEKGQFKEIGKMIDVAIQFAWGLAYSHERGLVHQDIKPANVMMTKSGVAKVTDFGLAQARHLSDADSGSGSGDTVAYGGMTPAYCSPEQANKQRLTAKTDMWSWATSILEMFTGEVTWMYGVAAGAALDNYLSGGSSKPDIPPMPAAVADLLKKCFNEKIKDRPKDMMEVADILAEAYEQETGAPYPRKAPKAGRDTADSLNNRAISLLDLGRTKEAQKLWDKALFNEPHHPEATYNSGLVSWRKGMVTDVDLVRSMEEAIKSHGAESDCEYFMGLVHLERDDNLTAYETFIAIHEASDQKVAATQAAIEAESKEGKSKRLLYTFSGHKGQVTSVSVSGDGNLMLSGSDDHTARLWDIKSGKHLHTFDNGDSSVTACALGLSGEKALTGGFKSLRLWDTSSGELIKELEGHTDWVTSVFLSADDSLAITASWDKTVKLWDTSTGEVINTIEGCFGYAYSSADGDLVLTGVEDNTVRLMSTRTGELVRTFDVVPGALFLSPDAKTALLANLDNSIMVVDVETGAMRTRFSGHGGSITSLTMSADGAYALSGSYDKTIRLWDAKSGRCRRTFGKHEDVVNAVSFLADGKQAVSASWDKTGRLWAVTNENNFRAPIMVSMIQASEAVLSAGAAYETKLIQVKEALNTGNMITAARFIKEARRQPGFSRGFEAINAWSDLYSRLPRKTLSGGWESKTLIGHEGGVNDVTVSADGGYALTGGSDNIATLWEIESGEAVLSFEGHTNRITAVALSDEGTRALTASGDATMRLWNTENGETITVMTEKSGAIHTAALSADGKFALSGGEESELRLWDTSSGRTIRTLGGHSGPITSVAFSADGRYAISGSDDRTARIWELVTGMCLRVLSGHAMKVTSVAISVDGKLAVTGSDDGELRLWGTDSADCLKIFIGANALVNDVAISFDNKYILSCDQNRTVRLWSCATAKNLRVFEGHAHVVNSVAFAPTGKFALSASDDKTVKVWTLDWELEEKEDADWDEAATSYLMTFLTQLIPYASSLPEGRDPFEKEVTLALTRKGVPEISDTDFERLRVILGFAGFGWLKAEGVRKKLDTLIKEWSGLPVTIEPPEEEEGPAELAVGEKMELEEDEDEDDDADMKTTGLTGWMKSFGTKKKEG